MNDTGWEIRPLGLILLVLATGVLTYFLVSWLHEKVREHAQVAEASGQ